MRIKSLSLSLLFLLSLFALSCSQGGNPVGPESVFNGTTSAASLAGNVTLSGASLNYGLIQIRIKGTTQSAQPDNKGDFVFDNIPLGNQVVEVQAGDVLTDIPIQNVKSGDHIRVRIEIKENCHANLAHMERDRKPEAELNADIRPGKWNLNWDESTDEVNAKISGQGFDTIVSGSVKLVYTDGVVTNELPSLMDELGGTYFTAKFPQSGAIALIPDPISGMSYEIQVLGTNADGAFVLTDTILVHGKNQDDEVLSMQLDPKKWNMNWANSSGYVVVKLRGAGFDMIDPASVKMIGPVPDELEIPLDAYTLGDEQFLAKFIKMNAFGVIVDPQVGETYTIRVTGDVSGGDSFDFPCVIEINGKKDK